MDSWLGVQVDKGARFTDWSRRPLDERQVDYAIGDVTIPAGAGLILGLAAANRDPAEFADPDRLDIGRANAVRHLAFASGPHVCLGATLARYEGRIAIRAFLDRYPNLRLAGRPERKAGASIFQGFASLPLALNG